MKKNLFLLLIFPLFLISCQTEIDIELPDYYDKLVVDGKIENGEVAKVVLSKSTPASSLKLDLAVTDAKVTLTSISTGESEELTLAITGELPIFYAYMGKNIKGVCGDSYELKIEWDNKIYTSKTSILNTFDLDSIWLNRSSETDTTATIRMLLSDNGAETNYYQFLVKVHGPTLNDPLWVYTLPAAFDDATFNGLTFNYEVFRASPSNIYGALITDEEKRKMYYRMTFRPGDTIYVKHSQMDYSSYQFWSSIMTEVGFGQNTFISSPPVVGNVKCNTGEKVLGAFCGYASKTDILVFPN